MNNKGEMLADILKKFRDCYFFLHNTRELYIVKTIMDEGFIFERQLEHSTDRINPYDPVAVSYFLVHRKEYGNFTVIIAIPKSVYDQYSAISNRSDTGIEEIMSVTAPGYGENDEMIYTIAPQHVLGYYNDNTSEFFQNIKWNPFFNNYFDKLYGYNNGKKDKK